MTDHHSYRQYAADCVRQAQGEASPDGCNILLNVALAWLRLARQTEIAEDAGDTPATVPDQNGAQPLTS